MSRPSKLNYFRERCDDGPKNQSFWKTIKQFMSDKSVSHAKQIILQERDKIINDTNEICEIFLALISHLLQTTLGSAGVFRHESLTITSIILSPFVHMLPHAHITLLIWLKVKFHLIAQKRP